MESAKYKRRRVEFSATVIRRIQSFLSPKLAIQSTLVSKSCRAAWSTRSTLVLEESQFLSRSSFYDLSIRVDALVEFATNTFRTYEESKVKTRIETFRLCLQSEWYGRSGLANEWTLKALELGATDLTFRFVCPNYFYIPIDDIFASQNVVSLCLDKSNIDRLKVTKCSALKSLTLSNMEFSTDLFFNIISCCPLIETLSLSHISTRRDENKVMGSLGKLTSLVLHDVGFRFQTLFLDGMSSRFPNLKDLSIRLRLRLSELDFFRQEKEIRIVISSPSLEILSFIYIEDENDSYKKCPGTRVPIKCDVSAEFDVPSIRKFTCEGRCNEHNSCKGKCIPKYMSFRSISRYQWESRISISHHGELSTKWFCELRRFLEKLRSSKMHVYLRVYTKKSFDYRSREIEGSNVLEVENLTMDTNGLPTLSFQVLLDALFRMCRPKMITQYAIYPPRGSDGINDTQNAININDSVLCLELIQGMKVKSFLIPSQFMYGLRDLEKLNAETLSHGVWRPRSLDDDSQRRFRLQLKWKVQSTCYPYLPRVSFPLSIMAGLESADHEYSYDALPEAIIHRIQSLLSHRESAQTAVLSKSWLAAWSTRPTIYLSDSLSPRDYNQPSAYPELDPLTMLATDTFRRYEDSNLRIDTFRLCLSNPRDWFGCSGLAAKWTSKALQMGATDLTFRSLKHDYHETTIPIDQLFRSENLVSLRLQRVNIDKAMIECPSLKSLTLTKLKIPDDSFLDALVSSCPLLQNLSLSHVKWDDYDFDWSGRRRRKVKPDERRSTIRLSKLTSLLLHSVMFEIETFFLDDLSSKFPNLRTLSFEPSEYKVIISSRSIEALTLKVTSVHEYHHGKFDVPGIRKFTFEGDYFPKLSFMSTSCDRFESHVLVENHSEPSTEWFCKLSEFLSQLRGSKIYLCLRVRYRDSFCFRAGEIKDLEVCEVEDLTMDTKGLPSISFDALLDGLFRMCRPRMITRYVSPPKDDDEDEEEREKLLSYMSRDYDEDRENVYDPENTVNNDISLCEALEQGVKVRSFSTTQLMYGLRDLEKVIAQQLFDGVWMPQPFDSVLDSLLKYDKSVRSEQIRRFRFQLKWKSRYARRA